MGRDAERGGAGPRLCYHGTDQEVRFGDEVLVRRLFRSARRGVVCHLHGGMSALPELEAAGARLWTVRDSDGEYHHFVYEPERPVAPRSVVLVSRAAEGPQAPSTRIPLTTPPC